jgi:type I restriction-modification system DNA methylase subunit
MSETIKAEIKKAQKRGKERVKKTAEVFTPMDLCLQMVREIPEEKLTNPNTTYLDNSCGDGNFLVTLLQVLTEVYGHPKDHVLNNQLFGVDLMPDNIATVKSRLGVSDNHPHFVCHNGLSYDYSFA